MCFLLEIERHIIKIRTFQCKCYLKNFNINVTKNVSLFMLPRK